MQREPLAQVASFRIKLGSGEPLSQSLDITGRQTILVDRIQAFLTVDPKATGALPERDAVRQAERLVRLRLALDRNDSRVITIGDVPAAIFSQLDQGPVPVQPFRLNGNEAPTVKVNYPPNLLNNTVMKDFGAVHLEVIFWGRET